MQEKLNLKIWIIGLVTLVLVTGLSFGLKHLFHSKTELISYHTFRYYDPQAEFIILAGDFNLRALNYRYPGSKYAMKDPDKDGWWKLSVKLPPGSYSYKFLINGTDWRIDPNVKETTIDYFGYERSVLRISENPKLLLFQKGYKVFAWLSNIFLLLIALAIAVFSLSFISERVLKRGRAFKIWTVVGLVLIVLSLFVVSRIVIFKKNVQTKAELNNLSERINLVYKKYQELQKTGYLKDSPSGLGDVLRGIPLKLAKEYDFYQVPLSSESLGITATNSGIPINIPKEAIGLVSGLPGIQDWGGPYYGFGLSEGERESVTISVRRKADIIWFIAGSGYFKKRTPEIGSLEIYYKNGNKDTIPLIQNENVCFVTDPHLPTRKSKLAFDYLLHSSWYGHLDEIEFSVPKENRNSEISKIVFKDSGTVQIPFLLAVTLGSKIEAAIPQNIQEDDYAIKEGLFQITDTLAEKLKSYELILYDSAKATEVSAAKIKNPSLIIGSRLGDRLFMEVFERGGKKYTFENMGNIPYQFLYFPLSSKGVGEPTILGLGIDIQARQLLERNLNWTIFGLLLFTAIILFLYLFYWVSHNLKFQFKLRVIYLVVLVIPLLILSWLTYSLVSKRFEEEIRDRAKETVILAREMAIDTICQDRNLPRYDYLPLFFIGADLPIDLAYDLKRTLGAEVTFFAYNVQVASTLPEEDGVLENLWLPPDDAGRIEMSKEPLVKNMVSDGEKYTVGALPLWGAGSKELGFIQVALSRAVINQHKRQVLFLLISACGLIFLLASIYGQLLQRGITLPITRLFGGMKRVMAGDYRFEIGVENKDEMGELTKTFNQMVEGLLAKSEIKPYISKATWEEAHRRAKEKYVPARLLGTKERMSILYADIVGFTTWAEKYPPDEVMRTLNQYFSQMSEIIIRNKGIIDKFMGDAILAYYKSVAEENEALLAVKSALKMQEFLKEFNKRSKIKIQNRMGINTGEVILGDIGSVTGRMDYTIMGNNVNLTERIEKSAQPGAILISESTYQKVKDSVEVKEIPELKLKGIIKPVKVYQIVSLKSTK